MILEDKCCLYALSGLSLGLFLWITHSNWSLGRSYNGTFHRKPRQTADALDKITGPDMRQSKGMTLTLVRTCPREGNANPWPGRNVPKRCEMGPTIEQIYILSVFHPTPANTSPWPRPSCPGLHKTLARLPTISRLDMCKGYSHIAVVLFNDPTSKHCNEQRANSCFVPVFLGDVQRLWIASGSWLQLQGQKRVSPMIVQIHCITFLAHQINAIKPKRT